MGPANLTTGLRVPAGCLGGGVAIFDRGPRFGLVLGAWALLGASEAASAADLGSGPPPEQPVSPLSSQWTLNVTPYGWLTFINGNATVKGRTADFDIDPIELLRHLDGVPFMGYAEARSGPLGLYTDIVYAPLGIDAHRSRSLDRVTLDASLGLDITQAIIEAGAVYEIARWSWGGLRGPDTSANYTAVDLLAGARYWHQDAELNLSLTATLDVAGLTSSRGRAVAREGSVDWVDPLVGLRFRHQLAPGQELLLRGDVGGFDAGSQFSWNVIGTYSFQIGVYYGATVSGVLGYRALSVDFVKSSGIGRYEFDAVQHGPILGLTAKF